MAKRKLIPFTGKLKKDIILSERVFRQKRKAEFVVREKRAEKKKEQEEKRKAIEKSRPKTAVIKEEKLIKRKMEEPEKRTAEKRRPIMAMPKAVFVSVKKQVLAATRGKPDKQKECLETAKKIYEELVTEDPWLTTASTANIAVQVFTKLNAYDEKQYSLTWVKYNKEKIESVAKTLMAPALQVFISRNNLWPPAKKYPISYPEGVAFIDAHKTDYRASIKSPQQRKEFYKTVQAFMERIRRTK